MTDRRGGLARTWRLFFPFRRHTELVRGRKSTQWWRIGSSGLVNRVDMFSQVSMTIKRQQWIDPMFFRINKTGNDSIREERSSVTRIIIGRRVPVPKTKENVSLKRLLRTLRNCNSPMEVVYWDTNTRNIILSTSTILTSGLQRLLCIISW